MWSDGYAYPIGRPYEPGDLPSLVLLKPVDLAEDMKWWEHWMPLYSGFRYRETGQQGMAIASGLLDAAILVGPCVRALGWGARTLGTTSFARTLAATAALSLGRPVVAVIPIQLAARTAPVAMKAATSAASVTIAIPLIRLNAISGLLGENFVAKEIIGRGWEMVGRHVAAWTPIGLRYIDILARTPAGRLVALEVKTGGAMRNAAQIAKDAFIALGARLVGKNANALRNMTMAIRTFVIRPR